MEIADDGCSDGLGASLVDELMSFRNDEMIGMVVSRLDVRLLRDGEEIHRELWLDLRSLTRGRQLENLAWALFACFGC